MPLTEQQAIERLWRLGHFRNPSKPNVGNVDPKDLSKLHFTDKSVQEAVASFQATMKVDLDEIAFDKHGRRGEPDGDVGPATEELFTVERCGHPDYGTVDENGDLVFAALEAVGNGNWPRCHGVGDYHAATVSVNKNGMGQHLDEVFEQVWQRAVACYMEIGLKLIRQDGNSNANIAASFVSSSTGWIGLAQLMRNLPCGAKMWQRYLSRYNPPNTVNEWTTLWIHETGHNVGLEHSSGGIMNPSIRTGLRNSWIGDPHENLMKQWYGGEPVPSDGPGPGPGPGPTPPPGGTGAPVASIRITVPADIRPGDYDLITVPRPQV